MYLLGDGPGYEKVPKSPHNRAALCDPRKFIDTGICMMSILKKTTPCYSVNVMRHVLAAVLAIMLFCSCNNLFYNDIGPVEPAPVVESMLPADKADGVFLNTSILIKFSTKMLPSTINSETIIVKKIMESGSEVPVEGIVVLDNTSRRTTKFSLPDGIMFDPQQKYSVTIRRRAQSLAGKKLGDDVVTTFMTRDSADMAPPELVYVSPEYLVNKANSIEELTIAIRFNEPIFKDYIKDGDIRLVSLNPGSIFNTINIYSDNLTSNIDTDSINITIKFSKPNTLKPPGQYRVDFVLPSSIEDLSGNQFEGTIFSDPEYSVDFRTPEERRIITHLESFQHPGLAPCWAPIEGSECDR